MDISFVAGFGPIPSDQGAAVEFWGKALGLELEELAPEYFHAAVAGVRAFALWPLAQAAEATFGTRQWPADRPVPQAWVEFDVPTHEAVPPAVEELRQRGCEVLCEAHLEPWGQTTARVQSPEGLLVGISHTPWLHDATIDADAAAADDAGGGGGGGGRGGDGGEGGSRGGDGGEGGSRGGGGGGSRGGFAWDPPGASG